MINLAGRLKRDEHLPCNRLTNRPNSLKLRSSMSWSFNLKYVKATKWRPSGSFSGLAFSRILLYPSRSKHGSAFSLATVMPASQAAFKTWTHFNASFQFSIKKDQTGQCIYHSIWERLKNRTEKQSCMYFLYYTCHTRPSGSAIASGWPLACDRVRSSTHVKLKAALCLASIVAMASYPSRLEGL